MDNIDEFKKIAVDLGYDPQEVDAFGNMVSQIPQQDNFTTPSFSDMATDMGYAPEEIQSFKGVTDTLSEQSSQMPVLSEYQFEGSVLGGSPVLTQKFGNRNSRYNNVSGGVNRGADFGVPVGTPVFAPGGGDWQVVNAYSGASGRGMQNSGWGNSVLLRNTKTGETMRMSHLSKVAVRQGDIIKGGAAIGLSGDTGHATGPHLDVEYTTPYGKLSDVMRSPYASQFIK